MYTRFVLEFSFLFQLIAVAIVFRSYVVIAHPVIYAGEVCGFLVVFAEVPTRALVATWQGSQRVSGVM